MQYFSIYYSNNIFYLIIDKHEIYNNYAKKLSEVQLVKYNKIVDERKKLVYMDIYLVYVYQLYFIVLNYNFKKNK